MEDFNSVLKYIKEKESEAKIQQELEAIKSEQKQEFESLKSQQEALKSQQEETIKQPEQLENLRSKVILSDIDETNFTKILSSVGVSTVIPIKLNWKVIYEEMDKEVEKPSINIESFVWDDAVAESSNPNSDNVRNFLNQALGVDSKKFKVNSNNNNILNYADKRLPFDISGGANYIVSDSQYATDSFGMVLVGELKKPSNFELNKCSYQSLSEFVFSSLKSALVPVSFVTDLKNHFFIFCTKELQIFSIKCPDNGTLFFLLRSWLRSYENPYSYLPFQSCLKLKPVSENYDDDDDTPRRPLKSRRKMNSDESTTRTMSVIEAARELKSMGYSTKRIMQLFAENSPALVP